MEPQLQRPADYRVLARAYRPTRLSALIGQEALVRTLKNAFASGRVAHAFLLSGIRGVGKTTTARIIARGLNCTGPDGQGGPTPEPCGVCASCQAIDEDRALDVIEMDAASQTGKEDVLELLEGLQFLPSSSRYKVYILDEVHMLSSKAWNALLKTVEEPPPHAKFIFATTELRKVPITVLSRCQKFELRRVEPEELAAHLAGICAKEGVTVAPEALAMVARAAEGSVRDALSLLDQAIATAEGPVDGALVQSMLGLGDRLQLLDLFDTVMRGDAKGALERFGALYALGADPVAVAQDLLEVGHWLSRLKVAAEATSSLGIAAAAAERAAAMAKELSLPVLARAWQMLLRGHRRDPDRTGRARCRRDAAPAHRLRQRPALARPSWRGCCATAPSRRRPAPARPLRRLRPACGPSVPWRCRRRRDQRRRSCRPTRRPPSRRASPSSSPGCATAARRPSRPGCRRART